MDLQQWLDTALAYVKVIVWPGGVVWGIWMFRKQLRSFIDRVRVAKVPGVSFEVADQARHLSEQSETLPELVAAKATVGVSNEAPVVPEVDYEPEPEGLLGRMLLAWAQLELEARAVARRRGKPGFGNNLGTLFGELQHAGIVSKKTEAIARSLQRLRNLVVHQSSAIVLTPAVVDDFTETTRNLATILRAVPGVELPASI
ncbi:hypothetical protein [Microbacterium maritypicum]